MAAAARWNLNAIAAGLIAAGLAAACIAVLPPGWRGAVHERVIDRLLAWSARMDADAAPVVVVDIDAASLAAYGAWPWPRTLMARLVDGVGRAEPRALVIDILFEGADARSPAGLARRLGAETGRPEIAALADGLPDGDRSLAAALGRVPAVLGFALDPKGGAEMPAVPFLVSGTVVLPPLWRAAGAVTPPAGLLDHAAGAGALALPGDDDGLVRRAPLLVGVGGKVQPGLASEALRVAQQASGYRLDGRGGTLGIGDIALPVPPNGLLRLVPGQALGGSVTVVSATEILDGSASDARLRQAIVLVGSSAPELGGLRAAAGDPLTPTAMLHAAAVAQMLRGVVPLPLPYAWLWLMLLCVAGVAVGVLAAVRLRPASGAAAVAGFAAALAAAALVAAGHDRIFDPVIPMLMAAASFAAAALAMAAETQLRERRIRQRFAQHLAPAVVEMIAADPSMLKLRGERREITALFTDLEGFTAMTQRADPASLVAVLDDYFEGVVNIVIEHDGMIDKFVGDAVHAFFNMPLDLAEHPRRAVECAMAIRAWTETYRRRELPARLGLGRTRIGIETGPAIVGDIGVRTKLDYTAYGDTVNAAARLEAANKEIGSSICVGPGTAARCPASLLRPTGTIGLRGFDAKQRSFEPWPADADAGWRSRYLDAMARAETDPGEAAALLAVLASERPEDAVAERLARAARVPATIHGASRYC